MAMDLPPARPKPLFTCKPASDTLLLALGPDYGAPSRKTWETQRHLHGAAQESLFRLKAARLPELEPKKTGKADGKANMSGFSTTAGSFGGSFGLLGGSQSTGSLATAGASMFGSSMVSGGGSPGGGQRQFSGSASTGALGGLDGAGGILAPEVAPKPISRAQRYYQALLKAERKRNELNAKDEYDETIFRAEGAAATAAKAHAAKIEQLEKEARGSTASSSSSSSKSKGSDDEEEEEVEEVEHGPLVPYEGVMKVEIEIILLPPPGKEPSEEPEDEVQEVEEEVDEVVSEESTPRLDLSDELAALQEEMKGHESEDEEENSDDGLPEGLRKVKNIYDFPDPRLTLGLGGTMYFVPDAERYAMGPSLPPPPPPSLQGRRRIRLQPRLPLDISNHRYRDEHPNIWPAPPHCPDVNDRLAFERKLCAYDFYVGVTKAVTQMPQRSFKYETNHVQQAKYEDFIDTEMRKSVAWQNFAAREKAKQRQETLATRDHLMALPGEGAAAT